MKKIIYLLLFTATILCSPLKADNLQSTNLELLDSIRKDPKFSYYQENLDEIGVSLEIPGHLTISGEKFKEILLENGVDFDKKWNDITKDYTKPDELEEILRAKELPFSFVLELNNLRTQVNETLEKLTKRCEKSLLNWLFPKCNYLSSEINEIISSAQKNSRMLAVQSLDYLDQKGFTKPQNADLIKAIALVLDSLLSKESFMNRLMLEDRSIFEKPSLDILVQHVIKGEEVVQSECLLYPQNSASITATVGSMNCASNITVVAIDKESNIEKYYIDEEHYIHCITDYENPYAESTLDKEAILAIELVLELIDHVFTTPQNIKLIYGKDKKIIYLVIEPKIVSFEIKNERKKHTISKGSPALEILPTVKNQKIGLEKIIEAYFGRQSLNYTEEENPIRKALTVKWVRNASKRVFHDPLRSFLEILVNAYDASIPSKESVGKFGMGFFSILSFLSHEEADGTTIDVETCYKMGNGELYAYKISFSGKTPQATFTELNPKDFDYKTGTRVRILPSKNKFSKKTLQKLKNYAHYLDFYEDVQLQLQFQETPSSKLEKFSIGNYYFVPKARVFCKLLPHELFVEDLGVGIALSDAFFKLLVPSSSTKSEHSILKMQNDLLTKEKIASAELVNFKGKSDLSKSHFIITVNNVVVIDKIMANAIKDGKMVKDLLIAMPQVTKLTLARDEIEISQNDNSFEEKYLKKIISQTIRNILFNNSNKGSSILLTSLFQGLEAWEAQSAATQIKGKFTKYFKKSLENFIDENKNIIPVPAEYYYNFKALIAPKEKIVLLPINKDLVHNNFSRLEAFLEEFYKKQTSKGKYGLPTAEPVDLAGVLNSNQILTPPKSEIYGGGLKPNFFDDKIIQKGLNGEIIAGTQVFFVNEKDLPKSKYRKHSVSDLGLQNSLFVSTDLIKGKTAESLANHITNRFTKRELITYQTIEGNNEIGITASNLKFEESKISATNTAIDETIDITKLFSFFTKEDSDFILEFLNKNKKRVFQAGLSHHSHGFLNLFFGNSWDELNERLASNIVLDRDSGYNNIVTYFIEGGSDEKIKNRDSAFFAIYLTLDSILINQSTKEALFTSTFYGIDHNEKTQERLDKLNTMMKKNKSWELLENIRESIDSFSRKEGEDYYDSAKKHVYKTYNSELKLFARLISESGIKIQIHEFMNSLLGSLLLHYGITTGISEEDQDKTLIINKKQIWPIRKEDLTVEKLEDLFITLTYHIALDSGCLYSDYPEQITIYKNRFFLNEDREDANLLNLIYPGLDKKALNTLIEKTKEHESKTQKSVLWATSMENTLQYAIDNIKILPLIEDLTNFYSVQTLNFLTTEKQQLLNKLHDIVLGLYNRYLDIPDSRFRRDYGNNLKKAHSYENKNDIKYVINAYQLLIELQKSPSTFDKLIDFQIEDFRFKTDVKLRDADLANRCLHIPSMFENTPLSILTLLMEKEVDIDVIKTIINEAKNPEELMFISYVLLNEECIKICKFKNVDQIKKNEILLAIKLLISYFLQENIDHDRISEIYQKNRTMFGLDRRKKIFDNKPASKVIIEHLQKVMLRSSSFRKRNNLGFSNADSIGFSLKQLLKAHVSGKGIKDLLQSGNLGKLNQKVKSFTADIDIAKITQDIEAGSEKNPIEASIIESLQNSIDAIKSFFRQSKEHKPQSANINYEIEEMNDVDGDTDKTHLCLTMRDYIGFPNLETLLTDFILPDYTNKSPELGNIGDMGNGSFKMYQHSKKVSILTKTLEGPTYLLTITPIKSPLSGLVEDLNLICTDFSEKIPEGFSGTSIRILFEAKQESKTPMDLLYTKDLLLSVVSTTQVDLPNGESIHIFFDDEELSSPKEIVHELNDPLTGEYICQIRKRKNPFMPSYITTGGIPFRTFASVIKETKVLPSNFIEILDSGFILDINVGYYEPVQSRTRLQIKPELIEALKRFLLDTYYIVGLEKGKNNKNFLEHNFIHFGSSSSKFYQLRLSEKDDQDFQHKINDFFKDHNKQIILDQGDFFVHYRALEKSFFEEIEDGYVNLVEQLKDEKAIRKNRAEKHLKSIKDYLKSMPEHDERGDWLDKFKQDHETFARDEESSFTEWRGYTFNKWKNNPIKRFDPFGLIEKAVIPWFEKKVAHFILELPEFNSKAEQCLYTKEARIKIEEINNQWKVEIGTTHKVEGSQNQASFTIHLEQLLEIDEGKTKIELLLTEMIFQYCIGIIDKIGVAKKNLKSAVFRYEPDNNALAYYSPVNREIILNLAYMPITDFIDALQALIDDKERALSQISAMKPLVPKKGYTPVLIHEIEHARRNEDPDISFHNRGINPYGEKVDFDVCASDYAREAISNGLLEELQQTIIEKAEELFGIPQKEIAVNLREFNNWIQNNAKNKEEKEFVLRQLGFIQ